MAQGDLTKLEGRLHTAVTSPRRRSRPGRYGRTEWPCLTDSCPPPLGQKASAAGMDSAGPGWLQVARVPRPAGAVAQVEPGADSLTADGTERLKLRINV